MEPRQPMQPPKKSNKKLVIGIILALLCIAAVTAFFLLRETPEQKLQKYLDLGAKYLEEEDYENAIAAYDSALEIDPNHADAIEGEITAYVAWSDVLVESEEYEMALEILNEGYDKFDDDRLKAAIDKIEAAQKIADIRIDILSLIEQATDICQSGDYLAVAQLLDDNDDILSELADVGMDRYIYDDTDRCSAGIYIIDGEYYIYVGDYANDNREGNGTWVSSYHSDYDGYAYAIGQWSNDAPNGQQEVTAHHGAIVAEVNFTRGINGEVVDGLWNGDVIWFFGDESRFAMSFNQGIVNVISFNESNDDDAIPYHVGESLTDEEGGLSFDEEDIQATWGVPGYADEW